jgi:hypothetical protein
MGLSLSLLLGAFLGRPLGAAAVAAGLRCEAWGLIGGRAGVCCITSNRLVTLEEVALDTGLAGRGLSNILVVLLSADAAVLAAALIGTAGCSEAGIWATGCFVGMDGGDVELFVGLGSAAVANGTGSATAKVLSSNFVIVGATWARG